MSHQATLINLEYENKLLFSVPVPDWSTQHELIINSSSSWIKYPSPNGWHWLKFPIPAKYIIIGLTTPKGLKKSDGIMLNNGNEIFATIIRSHIVTSSNKYNFIFKENNVYLVVEMFM